MKTNEHDRLTEEIGKFVEHLHEDFNIGLGVIAIDLGNNGDVCLGMLFGKKSSVNDRVLKRLHETCESTIRGAKAEIEEAHDIDDLPELPDASDKKAVAKFIVENDLLNEDGEIDRKKADALFSRYMEKTRRDLFDKLKGDK